MATILRIDNSSATFIDFMDSTKYLVHYGSLNMSRKSSSEFIYAGYGLKTKMKLKTPEVLEITMDISVTGTTQSDMLTNWNLLGNTILWAKNQTEWSQVEYPSVLKYQRNGAAAATYFDIIAGDLDPQPGGGEMAGKWTMPARLMLVCQPFGRAGTSLINYGGAGTAIFNYTKSGTVAGYGDIVSGCKLLIKNSTGGNYDFIRVAQKRFSPTAGTNLTGPYYPGTGFPTGYSIIRSGDVTTSVNNILYSPTSGPANGTFDGAYTTSLGSDLVFNGGFASGDLTSWTTTGSPNAYVASGFADVGTYSAFVDTGDGLTAFLSQAVTVQPGLAYRFSIRMHTGAAQPAGVGAKALLIGVGSAGTSHPSLPNASKVLVESGTSYTTHTWDFIAEAPLITIRLYDDGTGTGFFDTISLTQINSSVASGWTAANNPPSFDATDTEGETAGTRAYQGTDAQGIGSGGFATSTYVTRTMTVGANADYKIRCRIRRVSGVGKVYVVFGTNGSGTPTTTLSSSSPIWTTVEATLNAGAGATTGQVYIFCDGATGGIVDQIAILPTTTADRLVWFGLNNLLQDQRGTYRCCARIKTTTQTFVVNTKYGGSDGGSVSNKPVAISPSTTFKNVDLGVISIPEEITQTTTPIGVFGFGIWISIGSLVDWTNTGTMEIGEVELIPIDEWCFEVEATAAGRGPAIGEYIVVDTTERDPLCYKADSGLNFVEAMHFEGTWPTYNPAESAIILVHVCRNRNSDNGGSDKFALDMYTYGSYSWVLP